MADDEVLVHRGGLWFAWNRSRTVNVRHEPTGPDVDVFSFGYDRDEPPTFEQFLDHVDEWLAGQTDN